MRRILSAALLLGLSCASPPPPRSFPQALQATGIPPVPAELAARLAPYQDVAGTAFQDWGPDGAVLVSRRDGPLVQLHVVPAPGAPLSLLTRGSEPVAGGRFLPDGDVLFSRAVGGNEDYQVFRVDRRTGTERLLTDGRSRNLLGPSSRKGDRAALTSNRRDGRNMDVGLMDVATGRFETLFEAEGESWSVSDWAPDDGSLLLLRYVSVAESHPFRYDLSKRGREGLSPLPGAPARAACASLRFLEDGKGAVYCTDAGGEWRRPREASFADGAPPPAPSEGVWDVEDLEVHGRRIAIVENRDGVSLLRLQEPDGSWTPALPPGVLGGLRFSPDGRRLGFTLSRSDAPSDAYALDLETRRLERWTTSPTPGLDPAGFVLPERIRYRSFDGLEIPAFLYRPRGAARAPVAIQIHGGPESQFRPSFNPMLQSWVRELGIAVIAPNVRGSTGYGRTYTSLDDGPRREDSVRDIGALLDWIGAQPGLDASRVAAIGGSYGGYMVLASLVNFGERIRAGVDIVGIADFRSFLERTRGYRVDLRRAEYGDERDPAMREVFDRISPLRRAGSIRSALFVVHGRNDPRVPFFEAEQIVAKVRAAGRPVWTLYADNEGHGFARRENRDALAEAVALFFRRHLLD